MDAGVFVARRRSEFLVHEATAFTSPEDVILDLCCGSGALGVALCTAVAGLEVHAADIQPAAVACTRRNLEAHGGRVYEGDLFDPVPEALKGRIDILLCNTPYVPTNMLETMPPEARLHEPQVAHDGGPDGLDVQRRVAADASHWLAPGGHLLVETSTHQAPHTAQLFERYGLLSRTARSQQLDATVVIGTRPQI